MELSHKNQPIITNTMKTVEITKEAFRALVPAELPCVKVKETELSHRIEWESYGITVIQLENYASGATQYYVQDINL